MTKATLCENPFDLTRDRSEVDLREGETIAELIERARPADAPQREYVVSCNGEVLPPERALTYVPRQDDDVALIPLLQNQALRTIAVIGVAVAAAAFAGPLGGFLASTFGVAAGSAGASALVGVAGALISVTGNLLVAGIASLFQKTPGGSNYGVLGPTTTARSGILIPKGYGTFRRGFNIVESWVDIQGNNGDQHDVDDGADTIGRQYINVRCDAGWGPARAVENLQLNGKDIHDYADVAYCFLYGTRDQAPVTVDDPRWVVLNRTTTGTTTNDFPTTGFDTINNNFPHSVRVRAGVARNYVIIPGQRVDTQKLTVFVVFPQGAWRTDDNKEIKRAAIDYDVFFKSVKTATIYLPDGGVDLSNWTQVPPTAGNDYTFSTHYYYHEKQTTLRQATIIDGLEPDRYDVAVRKNGSGAVHNPLDYYEHENNEWGEQLWVESVQETSYTTLAYGGMIQVLLRFMATDQLAGQDVSLLADITHGLHCTMDASLPDELAGFGEDNPALVAYDVLSDGTIGGNLPDSRKDLNFFAEWAEFCDALVDDGDGGTQKLARFNGVYQEDNVSVWAAANVAGTMSRTNLQRIGTRVTGWLEREDVPVQAFHVGNILKDSYSKKWLNLEDRAQEITVSFADKDDDYKTRNPCKVTRTATLTTAQAVKKQSVNLLGCDDRVQAYYFAAHQLLENELSLATHTWSTNQQGIRCRSGNVVKLQQDVPTNSWGGHVLPGSTADRLLLDRIDLPAWDSVNGYQVEVMHPALLRATVNINVTGGNVLGVTGYDGSASVMRLRQGDVDVAVRKATPTTLQVDDPTGLVSGPAELWDLDVAETRSITGWELTTVYNRPAAAATLQAPLSAVPAEYCGYFYQSTTRVPVLVRVRGVKRNIAAQRFTITGIDYTPAAYDIPAPIGSGA